MISANLLRLNIAWTQARKNIYPNIKETMKNKIRTGKKYKVEVRDKRQIRVKYRTGGF